MSGKLWHRFGLAIALSLLLCISTALGQTARISGFVSDGADGQVLEGATAALYLIDQGYQGVAAYGRATTSDGLYLISGIDPGTYLIQISFVGYEAHQDTLQLVENDVRVVSVTLARSAGVLDDVLIESERLYGVARIAAGRQRIAPEEIALIPGPDISGDLSAYLTTLPGVVTTGDRGGQFFVRGGEPSQNLVMLDGMIVYQPFHALGSYSIFPADIIDRVDFFAGGFGASYGGRLSSVIDVSARPGNNRRFAGRISASPFMGAVRLEGPIVPSHASFLISVRESLVHHVDESLYGEEIPFQFGDFFAKLYAMPSPRHRLEVAAFSSNDRGTLVADVGADVAQEVRWKNGGGSLTWLLLPQSFPMAAEVTLSRSHHEMQQGVPTDTVRITSVRSTRIALDATFAEGSLFGGRSTTLAGWEVVFGRTDNELGGIFQNVEDRDIGITAFGVFVEPQVNVNGINLHLGLRMQTYNVRHLPYLEPRIRASVRRGIHQFSAGFGVYHQHIVGLSDRRDAASVFTAWSGIPRVNDRPPRTRRVRRVGPRSYEVTIPPNLPLESLGGELIRGRLGTSIHALVGYRSSPATWLEYAVEGFYKRSTNLFVGELTALSRLTTRLLPATGRSVGLEARVEVRRDPIYAYVTYGISNTLYEADGGAVSRAYETNVLRYRPPHDRRHHANVLFSMSIESFDLSARWHFGSGLPYTQPLAFDRFILIDDTENAMDSEASSRVIYDTPFGAVLPTYHRLDISVARTWDMGAASLTLQGSVINVYDRRNIFYVDTYTLKRKDQLPFVPSLGLSVAFR